MSFTLPALPYAHEALEPHFDTLTMQIHHGKHHQAYVDNLNKAVAGTPNEGKSLEELVAVAGTISPAVRNNGGGSLKAAIDIAGLFIEKGPVVQVKNSFGKVSILHADTQKI